MQESTSTYELVEVSTGGKLSRHNLHVQQLGPDTVTELLTFHLSVSDQTQDLHSSLVLDHPRAYSRQLHKCIVAHSLGQAVFDGNIKVNRYFVSSRYIWFSVYLLILSCSTCAMIHIILVWCIIISPVSSVPIDLELVLICIIGAPHIM